MALDNWQSDDTAAADSPHAAPSAHPDEPQRRAWAAWVDAALGAVQQAGLLHTCSFVDGAWVDERASACAPADAADVIDPASSITIARTTWADAHLMDAAIDAAARAQTAWADLLPLQRAAGLRRWAGAVRDEAAALAQLITLEQGKPLHEAQGEVQYAASFIDWFAAEAERVCGETIVSHKAASRLTVDWQPVGVVGLITPWNFPSAMITRKAAAALAVGCTVVVKPAPQTPLSALALAALAERVGLPAGVFNVVHGHDATLAAQMLARPEVRALSFTGSTPVGRTLMAQASATVKRVSLELGGHAPFIVFDDADIDTAVSGCMAAKFATSGQDCLAANRVYVQRGIHDAFCRALAQAVQRLSVGHGLAPGVDIGPMTRAAGALKCAEQVADAVRRGAQVAATRTLGALGANFVAPTLLTGVTDDMAIAREETFGPVLAVLAFDDEAEVIARANASEMGLAAYVYTESLGRATRTSQRLAYGMVGVNTASFTGPPIPFGGWKQSGLGREGSHQGTAEFLACKYTCIGGLTH